MTLLEVTPHDARLSARLAEIRATLDALATDHCNACMGKAPAPDFSSVPELLKEVTGIYDHLPPRERVKADMMVGCGWHMLREDDKALEPLLRVAHSSGGVEAGDQLSAILVAMQLLRKKSRWGQIIQAGDKAFEVAGGKWADPVLPFLKGVSLARLNQPAEAADVLEEAIAMNPGFKQAYLEFDQACTALRDFARCRKVAQNLVEHGGHWVNCWQRPLHFHAGEDPKVTSRPWYDPSQFEMVRCLEENFVVIKNELEALCAKSSGRWGGVGTAHRGNQNSCHDADLVAAGEWQEVVLLGDSDECIDNGSHCPATTSLLNKFDEVRECAEMRLGESLFSRLQPGTHLRPHCGPTNMRLTCHLGLDIPEGCRITCAGESREWETGKCIVFDDSFEHEVIHEGSQPRTVLLVNFWHPDIPRSRRAELRKELGG
ncbi:ASPH [Symbiodinium natans]|uniref:ASPH protein n=1 Tax=Symbiodinium natans TaxID=878477 RepID=A0A812T633_9DINO|nr:ASPH [Symbiodinium natans]